MQKRFAIACALSLSFIAGVSEAADSTAAMNVVVQWNATLLSIVRTPGAQPATLHPTRSFAMMHAAIYDAVNAIDQKHQSYAVKFSGVSRRASQDAAAAAAAHGVLVALYPTFTTALAQELTQSLTQLPNGPEKAEGVGIGRAVAAGILALRRADGAHAPPIPYVFGTAPGDYQSTSANATQQPQFTHWSHVTPFMLRRANQFRPGPPPPLASEEYSDAFEQVASLGIADSPSATADEALSGRFWNGAIQNYWNEIAQTASRLRHLTTAQNARLFALLNLSIADSVIAFYDAKYTYNLWRPVTAVRAADSDDNPDTSANPDWLPQVGNTTPDPSYPGAHAVISTAAEEVLVALLERNRLDFEVTSEVLPGVSRSFTSLSASAEEASSSRIFAGVHFRFDLTTGQRLGREVADFALDHFLTARHADSDDERR